VLLAIDGKEIDADLGVFENGAELFFAGGEGALGGEDLGV